MTVYKWLVLQTADGGYHRERQAQTGKYHNARQLLQSPVPFPLYAIKLFTSRTAELIDIQLIRWEQEDSLPRLLTEWPQLIDQRAQSDSLIWLREGTYSTFSARKKRAKNPDVKRIYELCGQILKDFCLSERGEMNNSGHRKVTLISKQTPWVSSSAKFSHGLHLHDTIIDWQMHDMNAPGASTHARTNRDKKLCLC